VTETTGSPLQCSRRVLLRGAAAVGLAGGTGSLLVACGGGGAGQPSDAGGGAGGGDAGGSAAGGERSGGAGDGISAADIGVGEARSVEIDGRAVIVAQPTAGEFMAYDATCPHAGCTVAVAEGLSLACPCHASMFDATDGSVTGGPAQTGLTELDATMEGDRLVVS
jgi:nitrite reductase/ring-hydroxylating ferredoxin subunit